MPLVNRFPAKREEVISGDEIRALGLVLAPATTVPDAGDEGVTVIRVDSGSEAAKLGLRPRDVILDIAGQPVATPHDVLASIDKALKRIQALDHAPIVVRVKPKGWMTNVSGERQRLVTLPVSKGVILELTPNVVVPWEGASRKAQEQDARDEHYRLNEHRSLVGYDPKFVEAYYAGRYHEAERIAKDRLRWGGTTMQMHFTSWPISIWSKAGPLKLSRSIGKP
jgi:hypothetical protein